MNRNSSFNFKTNGCQSRECRKETVSNPIIGNQLSWRQKENTDATAKGMSHEIQKENITGPTDIFKHVKVGVNNRENITSISSLCKEYSDLLTNEDEFYTDNYTSNDMCPQIMLKLIDQLRVSSLVDSGSQISCINENYFYQISRSIDKRDISILPVSNLKISTATSQRSLPIKKLIMLTGTIQGRKHSLKLYVVPNLSHKIILGIDTLNELNA